MECSLSMRYERKCSLCDSDMTDDDMLFTRRLEVEMMSLKAKSENQICPECCTFQNEIDPTLWKTSVFEWLKRKDGYVECPLCQSHMTHYKMLKQQIVMFNTFKYTYCPVCGTQASDNTSEVWKGKLDHWYKVTNEDKPYVVEKTYWHPK